MQRNTMQLIENNSKLEKYDKEAEGKVMKIKKLRIMNYRGIKDSGWLEFEDLNAIVGKNDSGKSSILHAINDFYNENKLLEGNRYYGAVNNATQIEIKFSLENQNIVPSVLLDDVGELHIKKCANEIGETYKCYIVVNDFSNDIYQNIFQLTAQKYNTLLRNLGKEVPDKITKDLLFEVVNFLAEQEGTFEIKEYEIKNTLLKEILKELYPQFSLFLADTNLDTGTSSFQNQFKKIVTNAIETHLEEFSNLQEEVSNTLNDEINKIGHYMEEHYSGMTNLSPKITYDWSKLINFDVIMQESSGYHVDLANKGTGIQRLFMVSYFQYLAENFSEEESTYVFVIEEPETFLHPGAQRTLLNSLKKISNNHQIIITTHSPVFASEISNRNIIVAIKEDGESKYEQGESVSSESLVEELGVRASDSIISSKLLVFVEGSNDVKFWNLIYKKVTGHFYEDDKILFIPGGGNELHNIAEMNLMRKLNRNFMVIVDKDAGAVDYETKLQKQERLKNIVEQKGGQLIVLRKREIENYYNPNVIIDTLAEKGHILEELEIEPYEDFPAKMKALFNGQNVQMKFKNNMSIFEKMTLDEWQSVSTYIEDGEAHFELGEIVQIISNSVNNEL